MVVELDEEFFVVDDFVLPGGALEFLEFVEFLFREIQAVPFHVAVVRDPADGGFAGFGADPGAINDPFEDAHVFAVAGPNKLAVGALAEPVHVTNARRDTERALHLDPVTEVVAHAITAERKYDHAGATDFADGTGGGSGHFGAHGGANVNAGAPVEGLIDERHGGGATSAEDESVQRDAVGIFPGGINRWTLRCWRGEAGVRMRGLRASLRGDFGSPGMALPIGAFGRRRVGHAFPPDATVRSERYVGEDGVARERGHGVGIGFFGGAGGDAEEARFRIDGAEMSVFVGTNPGDVVADGPNLPAFESLRRNEHGEIGFSASAGECSS